MCGIYALISSSGHQKPDQKLQDLLCKRGPDHIGHENVRVDCKDGSSYWISLTSTVLALRGGVVTSQPFIDTSTQSLFCWNGEAWKIGSEAVEGNDGQAVFESLVRASSARYTVAEAVAESLKVLRSISGPFAFFFVDQVHSQIYYGRDRLGRRSLLFRIRDGAMEFASIADSVDDSWYEVEANGIFHIPLSQILRRAEDGIASGLGFSTSFHSWDEENALTPSLGIFNKNLPEAEATYVLNTHSSSVQILREQLTHSLKLRVLNVPIPPGLDQEHNVRIAILFSGGLDCTVLARLAHVILPSEQHIDLINVAFENPRVVQAAKNALSNMGKSKKTKNPNTEVQVDNISESQTPESQTPNQKEETSAFEKCPDRETGRKAFQELRTVCPERVWRFVAVNVPYIETVAHRETVIGLIHPHNTEMDLSIAYALYFAARGTGVSSDNESDPSANYTTPARVLLSGLGADELFGGYTRHATAFNRQGCEGLLEELELDVNRLGKRNLGRDDRVISHWGREARFPYLDESLVKWAVECPIWEKYGLPADVIDELEIPEIEAGKKVLRLLAYTLGMHSVAQEKKRAIQFGARTAKMEVGGRMKGTKLIS